MVPDMETSDATSYRASSTRRPLTRRERRRRWWLLAILLVLLALLSYATYYFIQNRRLPMLEIGEPEPALAPPQYLYSITGSGANELIRPVGVGVAPDGRVYVVDFGHRRVSVFTNSGRFIKSFNDAGGKPLQSPVHLWVQDGEVWVTDRRLRSLEIFDLEGEHLRTYDRGGEDFTWTPLAFALDSQGRLRVTDVGLTDRHRVHFFSEDGSRTVTVGRTVQVTRPEQEPLGFMFPNGVAIADDGRVFISDGDNRRVQVLSPEGEFKGFVDTSGIPRGIAIDAEKRLYVVDAISHTVDVYDLDGKRLVQFGGQGFGPGQFNYANDVAIDRRGKIYVSDRENNQVQVWGWPVAEPPTIVAPTSPLGWALCLTPLLLLPLPFLLRKKRVVVTPDFMEALILAEEVAAVAAKRRLRLVAPLEDEPLYEGRVAEDVRLDQLIEFDAHSESDVRALVQKLEIDERDAVLISIAERVAGLATQDLELRRTAVLADVTVMDIDQFLDTFVRTRT